jgi:hypothetical protein
MATWHVRIAEADAIGPIGTDLVVRGVVAGRVPLDALVRRDGDARWIPIARVAEFREAVRHAPPPPARRTASSGPTSAPTGRQPSDVLVAHRSAGRQPLGPLERRVVSMLDGSRSIQEVSALVGLTVKETTSICEYLVALGVAAFTDPRPEAIELSLDDSLDPADDTFDAGWDEPPSPKTRDGR